MVKHVGELVDSLQTHEHASLLTVYKYEITQRKERQRSTHADEVRPAILSAISKGVQSWEISMEFLPDGVELKTAENVSDSL